MPEIEACPSATTSTSLPLESRHATHTQGRADRKPRQGRVGQPEAFSSDGSTRPDSGPATSPGGLKRRHMGDNSRSRVASATGSMSSDGSLNLSLDGHLFAPPSSLLTAARDSLTSSRMAPDGSAPSASSSSEDQDHRLDRRRDLQPPRRPKHRISFIDTVLDTTQPAQPQTYMPLPQQQHHHLHHTLTSRQQQHAHATTPWGPDAHDDDEPMEGSPQSSSTSRKHSWPSTSPAATPGSGPSADPAELPDHDSPSASSASGHLRTLLPAPADESGPSSRLPARKKPMTGRVQVAAACLACRKRKVKCNGGRPTCARCVEQSISCVYDSEPDSTRMLTLKRRQRELETEVDDLRDLFSFLQTRPEVDAFEIFRRIRTGPPGDVRDIVSFVRNGDLLLQGAALTAAGHDDPRALKIDEQAAAEPYAIQVPARPWTTIVGDGLVSELIGSFFAWDGVFWLPFVDRTCFVQDMRASKPAEARYCSPLLVHAICALRCSTSPRAKALSAVYGFDIRERFLNEAKKILDQELGRVSLPTTWALTVMFLCSSSQGRDRAGMMYRFTGYDMLKRMRLPHRLELAQDNTTPEEARVARRVYSRSLWGVYVFESSAAFVYLSPGVFPRPTIPRTFHDPTAAKGQSTSGFPDDYPLSTGILDASCDFADMYNEVMFYNRRARADAILGSQADLERRMEFVREVQAYREALPVDIRSHLHFSPATFFLDCFADQTLLALFRPLSRDTILPDAGLGTAGDVCISCCESGVAGAERYERDFQMTTQGYSIMAIYPLYNAVMTLVSMLDHPRAQDLFTRACRLLAHLQDDFPINVYSLHGVKAMAEKMGMEIPLAARPYFSGLKLEPSQLRDVPISFVLPGWDDAIEFLSHDGAAHEDGLGVELGTLIAKWNAMSAS